MGPYRSPWRLDYDKGEIAVRGGSNTVKYAGAASDRAADRSFADQTGTVYVSFLVNTATDNLMQFYLSDGNADNSNFGGIGLLNNTLRVRSRAADSLSQGASVTYTLGQTALVVGMLSKSGAYGANYDRMDLFVNPSSYAEPGTPESTVTADTGTGVIRNFALRTANFLTGEEAFFDEIRIGRTFASVVPVPEPGALTLLGLGLVALAAACRTNGRGNLRLL